MPDESGIKIEERKIVADEPPPNLTHDIFAICHDQQKIYDCKDPRVLKVVTRVIRAALEALAEMTAAQTGQSTAEVMRQFIAAGARRIEQEKRVIVTTEQFLRPL